ncbi:MAG: threonine ammonia-lyase [Bosea sp.]|uniref:threonine ammonia-lyase n=1 Tax=unclassified Bosea (in: a-proteobacteria) TaxID=2653178 RepID=UPI0009622FD0|nr:MULTISPECIES: threonine ammonia-lyase [unclassified Bosea (in: a-proteobacteria)]MBN9456426.1 threonine ammonia-lyase [Bosea sp. (in: a-proteobacteria)]OJV08682.1 MAG: threonine ammonia-lyase [Bosea sp. 67-29]
MTEAFAITPEDIDAAARRIGRHVLRTPLVPAPRLSELTGAQVLVKHENMQATASFKERGAVNKLLSLSEAECRRGVIAMSAGNHAQAVAYHAKRFGIPATIVMPEATPLVKVENTRAHGARVVLHGETLSESADRAQELAGAEQLVFVHPYDDAAVMAGQGTVVREMLADEPDLDVLVIPLGGGGLMAGNAVAAKAIKPGIELIGVEAGLYPSFFNAIHAQDRPIGGATLAEGIAVKTVGRLTLPIVASLVSELVLVGEDLIERAVNAYACLQHSLTEGAGAAGLAAMLKDPQRYAGRKVGLVLSGGNIDTRLLAAIMVRELEREDRIVAFRLTTSDRPGLLGRIASLLGEEGANILEVSHGRLFLDVPAKGVTLDVTVETRGEAHSRAIEEMLAKNGFAPRRILPRGLAEPAR